MITVMLEKQNKILVANEQKNITRGLDEKKRHMDISECFNYILYQQKKRTSKDILDSISHTDEGGYHGASFVWYKSLVLSKISVVY